MDSSESSAIRPRLTTWLPSIAGIALAGTACLAGASELHDAVRAGDTVQIETVLESGADIEQSDYLLGTALHVAVSAGAVEIAGLLIEHGADVEAVSEQEGSRALHLAARFGDIEMLRLLLDAGAQVDAADLLMGTPLYRAVQSGQVGVVRELVDRGADLDARDGKYGSTPLHEAAHLGNLAVVRLLVEAGADVNATDNGGWTPFMQAAVPQSFRVTGDGSVLQYLLANGADPTITDKSGMSIVEYVELQVRQGGVIFEDILAELRRLNVAP